MRRFDKVVLRLSYENMSLKEFKHTLERIDELECYDLEDLEQLRLLGLPLVKINENDIALATRFTPIETQKFCVVDIECNVSDPKEGQIIEIGALMVQNGKIIDEFSSFVKALHLPPIIEELTTRVG